MFSACLYLFQIFGFYPVKIGEKSNAFAYIVTTLNFLLLASIIVFMIIAQEWMLYSKTSIGKINDVLLYGTLVFAHLSMIIESFMQRKYFIRYWSFYGKIVSFQKKSVTWYKGFILKSVIFILFTVGIEITVITCIYDKDSQWTNFWAAEIFSLICTRIRNLQHAFFIDVIFFTLQDLNSRIKNLNLWTLAVNRKFSDRIFHSKIQKLKNEFKNLMEMIICVNRIFRWSQAFNVGQQFIEIVVELYWIYAFAISPDFIWGKLIELLSSLNYNYFSPAVTTICYLPTVVSLLLLMQSSTRCIKEVSLMKI
jgi:hypothetical protein